LNIAEVFAMNGDPLYELLRPRLAALSSDDNLEFRPATLTTQAYLQRLSTLSLISLETSEPEAHAQKSNSLLVSLQALAYRSNSSLIKSSDELSDLQTSLPDFAISTAALRDGISQLDTAALNFGELCSKRSGDALLDRRRKALLLSRHADRLTDILELPNLLSTAISSSTTFASAANIGYSSALDLNAHVLRLHTLCPSSSIILDVKNQANTAMQVMISNLVTSLKSPSLKLAAALRSISWLRRVAPELESVAQISEMSSGVGQEGSLGSLFLVSRLANLTLLLNALDPLLALANEEVAQHSVYVAENNSPEQIRNAGQHTEKYLKRYVEIFREQSFAIVSMFRSIFPSESLAEATAAGGKNYNTDVSDLFLPLPSALTTFTMHLVDMLLATLRMYLPIIQDRGSREGLLTQVLYCAGSLGRLGGDFRMLLSFLEDNDRTAKSGTRRSEWAESIAKHRLLAGRLEGMVGVKV
jgi:hypothetical protein